MALVPFNRQLIDVAMLTMPERVWIDDYHRQVRERVSPLLGDDDVIAWLETATKPLVDH